MATNSLDSPLPLEDMQVFEFRAAVFEEELGFSPNEAAALAVAKDETGLLYSTQKVKQLLDSGCTRELLLRIVL